MSISSDPSPYFVRDGVYGATFNKNGEPLYLRMELFTEENEKCWLRFKNTSCWIANTENGVLSGLVDFAGTPDYPEYEKIKGVIGFTNEEFVNFTEKAIKLKKTNEKIVKLLKANSVGMNHMQLGVNQSRYIVYITKNPNFSIQEVDKTEERNLKNFIESYKDILISVGTDFSDISDKGFFTNRGISRNPYWVFEENYSGFSMLLHGFTGVVAEKYFPKEKTEAPDCETEMRVKPVGGMQTIIKKHLLPGEGYVEKDDQKIDITELTVSERDPEHYQNHIKISALSRIYHQVINELKTR